MRCDTLAFLFNVGFLLQCCQIKLFPLCGWYIVVINIGKILFRFSKRFFYKLELRIFFKTEFCSFDNVWSDDKTVLTILLNYSGCWMDSCNGIGSPTSLLHDTELPCITKNLVFTVYCGI